MDRRDQWKSKPRNFQSREARHMRMDEQQSQRQNKREQQINRLRQVSPVSTVEEEIEDTPEYRAIRLEKWKVEKDLKKKLEAKKKRPAFVIGIPHHNFFSPASKGSVPHQHKKPRGSTPPKRVTAVTARRLAARQAAAAASTTTTKTTTTAPTTSTAIPQPSASTGKPSAVKSPQQPRLTRSRKKALLQAEKKLETKVEKEALKKISLAPENYEFKGPTFSRPIPLFGEVIIPDVATLNFNLAEYTVTTKIKISPLKPTQEMTEKTPPKRDKSPPREKIPQTTERVPKEETEAVVKQASSQSCDSSIESVVLRMSSQFEAPQEVKLPEEQKSIIMDFSPEEVVPAQFSPFIVSSRGKSNARKEQQQRFSLHKTSPKDDIPTKDTVIQNLNISIVEEKNTSQYYKHLVNSEEARLNELCSTWQPLQEDSTTPEDGIYMINQAIGQTKLLIKKKFERFKSLVSNCETGMGEQLVRCADLQGFWEMMQMEIRDCDSRFTKLEEIRGNGWKEEEEMVVKVQKKKQVGKKKKIEGRSNMRSFIEAQRKKRMAKENAGVEGIAEVKEPIVDVKSSLSPRKSLPRPVSPHSRARITPRGERLSLLKQVQLTESAKRLTQNSFAMIKVTQKCKTPEVQHDQSISYINSGQTPGKGILKKTENLPKTDGKQTKPTCKVNFNDIVDLTDDVPQEEEQVFANKKLVFDDDDSVDDSKHTVENDVEPSGCEPGVPEGGIQDMPPPTYTKKLPLIRIPTIELTEATPLIQPRETSKATTPSPGKRIPPTEKIETIPLSQPRESSENTSSPGKTSSALASGYEPESSDTSGIHDTSEDSERQSGVTPGSLTFRQLRNRTILIDDNVTTRRRRTSRLNASLQTSIVEEGNVSNDFGNKENSSGVENVKAPSPRTPKARSNLNTSRVRRSARKSARHVPDDDCRTCKPVPLTPRRFAERVSFFGNRDVVAEPLSNGDLMAFDSPRS